MIYKLILALIFLFISNSIFNQNLIANPDFENYSSCPTGQSQMASLNNWNAYTGTPDHCNTCNYTGSLGAGFSSSGSGFVSFFPYYRYVYENAMGVPIWNNLMSETFESTLISSVSPCFSYRLEFDIRCRQCPTNNSEIGAYFYNSSSTPPTIITGSNGLTYVDEIPQVSINASTVTSTYQRVSITFTPGSNYDKILVGSFSGGAITSGYSSVWSSHPYYSIDNMELIALTSVTPTPTSVSATPTSGCSGFSSNLAATCATGVVRWYNTAAGTGAGLSDPLTVNSNQTIYARCYNSGAPAACQYSTASSGIALTVSTVPTSPTSVSASPTSGCVGFSSNLAATCATGVVRWYNTATGTGAGLSDPLTVNSNQTVYARCYNSGAPAACQYGPASAGIALSVSSAPTAPTGVSASPTSGCTGFSSNLSATCATGAVRWYNSAAGTGGGLSDPLTVNSNQTVYARCFNSGAPAACQYGPASAGIALSVSSAPTAPTGVSASPTSGCIGFSSNLSATCATGAVRWYNSAAGTGSGLSDPLTVNSNQTVYARCYNSGAPAACQYGPASAGVSLSVFNTPTSPSSVSASPTSGCTGFSSNLSATCATGAVRWYNSAAGTGGGLSDPLTVNSNQTVYARCYNSGAPAACQYSPASAGIALSVSSVPTAPTGVSASPTSGCSGYTTALSATCATGVVRWYTISTGTGGGISASQTVSSPGDTYYARCFNSGNPAGCQYSSAQSVSVTASAGTPSPSTASASPTSGCSGYSSTLSGTCSAGVIRWYNTSTGTGTGISTSQTINSNITYYARCFDVGAPAGCQYGPSSSVALTVNSAPNTPTSVSASPTSGCTGFSSNLSATCATGAVRWYNSAAGTGGGLSDPLTVNSNQTVYARCFNAANPASCQYGTASTGVTLSVSSTPSTPTSVSASPTSGCSGYTTALSATCATGVVRWYTISSGTGSGISASQTVSSPGDTYYARCFNSGNPAGCQYSSAQSVSVTASAGTPSPSTASASPTSGCSGYSSTLSGTCSAGVIRWYNTSTGTGTGISTSQTINSNITYYARCFDVGAPAGCQYGPSSSVALTVNSSPNTPTSVSASPTSGCTGFSSNLSATCATGTVRWYNSAAGTGGGLSDPLTVNSNQTVYARCFNAANPASCQYGTASTGVTLSVSSTPSTPTSVSASPTSGCSGYTTALSATCATGVVRWYTISTGTGGGISASQTVSSPGDTYYARCFNSGNPAGCQYSSAQSVSVTASAGTPTPSTASASPTSGCSGYSSTLSGTCSAGVIRWYNTSTGTGAGISTSQTINSNITYYARCFDVGAPAGCEYGPSSLVALTVNTSPPTPTGISASSTSDCSGYTTNLSGTCATGVIRWYNSASGTGTGLSSPLTVNSNQTVYARCFNAANPASCQYGTADAGITLNVNTTPTTPTSVSASPISGCNGYTTALSANCATGVVRWYTTSTGTGAGISASQTVSSPGDTYYAKCFNATNQAACQYSSAQSVSVTASTGAPIPSAVSASPTSGCSGYSSTLSATCATGVVRWYTTSTGTGAGISTSQTINNNITYYARCYDLTAPAACQYGTAASVGLTVNTAPIVPSGISISSTSDCSGYTTNLSGTCATGVIRWYNSASGTGTGLSSPLIVNTNQTVYARCYNAANPVACQYGTADAGTVLSINTTPSIPSGVSASTTSDCPGYNTNLSGSCLTGVIRWYNSTTATGTGLTSPLTVNNNQTIYARCFNATNPITCQYGPASTAITLTASDINPPTVICRDTNVYLDATGNITITPAFIDAGSFDNCVINSITIDNASFTCADIGVNTVKLYVSDLIGNMDSCTANVTVLDTISPMLTICPIDTNITVEQPCSYAIPDYTSSISATDNCTNSSTITYTQLPVAGTIINASSPLSQLVTLKAMDASGNIDSCEFYIDINCNENFKIPQFFSPNNDGINDTWYIESITSFPNSNVKIYNRWGTLVFEMYNYDNSWSGISKKGTKLGNTSNEEKLPSGTYFYIVDKGNGEEVYTGYVVIQQ